MTSYDPMEELSRSLDSIDEKKDRRISVPPPPTDDFTAEIERPDVEADESDGDVAAPIRTDGADSKVESERAEVALPLRRRGRGLAARAPGGSMKPISASLPAHLIQAITELRLDAEVAGRSFKLNEMLSGALLELPLKASAVSALVDRYSSQFNYGRTSRDDDFLDERRLSTQISPDAEQRVATIIRAVFQAYGVKLAKKDLYALAALNMLGQRR